MIFFALPFLFVILPALAWNGRTLLGAIAAGVTGLIFIWIKYAPADASLFGPYSDGLFFGIFFISALGFSLMTIGRTIGLKLQTQGKSRLSVLWLDGLAILAIFAAVAPLIV